MPRWLDVHLCGQRVRPGRDRKAGFALMTGCDEPAFGPGHVCVRWLR